MNNQNFSILINSLAEGGAEKVVATLIPEFKQQGLDVPLICMEQNDVQKIESAQITYLSKQTGMDETFFKKFISLFTFARQLKKHIKANQVRLVQSHIYRANYVNVLAKLMGAGHKVQLVNHGIPEQYLKGGFSGSINRLLIRLLYPCADQVICPSMSMLDSLQAMGVSKGKLNHITNPVDVTKVRKMGALAISNEFFEFDSNKRYAISIGRLEPVKCTSDIVEAFATVTEVCPELELIILGSGSQREQLLKQIEQMGINERVHLFGHVDNPYQYLARCELFISASENEGFSLVIVEALALAVPVISTDCTGGPRDILAPGKPLLVPPGKGKIGQANYGVFFHAHDVTGLVRAMTTLLSDEELRAHYAEQGKLRSRDYDKVRTAGQYLYSTYKLMDAA
ncbi:MAG: glycosyltransferase involved in cell wall biosynthesis [Gammaproteobacteria bacterium]|jgi:glycosyltransferase involved in cell wall biosynthesis